MQKNAKTHDALGVTVTPESQTVRTRGWGCDFAIGLMYLFTTVPHPHGHWQQGFCLTTLSLRNSLGTVAVKWMVFTLSYFWTDWFSKSPLKVWVNWYRQGDLNELSLTVLCTFVRKIQYSNEQSTLWYAADPRLGVCNKIATKASTASQQRGSGFRRSVADWVKPLRVRYKARSHISWKNNSLVHPRTSHWWTTQDTGRNHDHLRSTSCVTVYNHSSKFWIPYTKREPLNWLTQIMCWFRRLGRSWARTKTSRHLTWIPVSRKWHGSLMNIPR